MLIAALLAQLATAQQPPAPQPITAPTPAASAPPGEWSVWQQVGAVLGTILAAAATSGAASLAARRFGTSITGPQVGTQPVDGLEEIRTKLASLEQRLSAAEQGNPDTRLTALGVVVDSIRSSVAVLDERTRVDRRELRRTRSAVHQHAQNLVVVNDRLQIDPPSLVPIPDDDDSDEPPAPRRAPRKRP